MGDDDKNNMPKIDSQNEPPRPDPDLISYEEKGFDPREDTSDNQKKK